MKLPLLSHELRLEAVEHKGGDEVDVIGLASDGDDAVAEASSGQPQHAAGMGLEPELQRDAGVGILRTDWLVVGKTSQCDLAKDRAGTKRDHAGRAPGRPPFAFGAGCASATSGVDVAGANCLMRLPS